MESDHKSQNSEQTSKPTVEEEVNNQTVINNNETEKNQEQQDVEKRIYRRMNEVWDEYYLNEFQKFAVTKFVKDIMWKPGDSKAVRARDWLLHRINNKKPSCHQMQRGCGQIIPGLRAIPWWDTSEFPWVKELEANYEVIRDELLSLRNEKGFQPYRGPSWISEFKAKDGVGAESVDSGQWNVFYLMLHDMKFDVNCNKVPKTMALIEKYIPNNYHHCFFSAVTKQTHIVKHYGPTNKKLRFHMPLVGVKGSRLRVANETRQQQLGKCYVFDDSFEHEAWHSGEETRIILIADFWHPDLTKEEIKFFNLIQKAKMKYQKMLSEHDPEKDNFYSIIETAKDLLKDNDWWVVNKNSAQDEEGHKKGSNATTI